ncbi:MAG: FtsX-like permease family protein [Planctomycetaceae bacterium]|jgi:lipoprotein-releasing system permease protein|nr:FtsX-like permease family protein [Planctomycetaceae bacterium]
MYKLLLCWRYLLTRYIALASIISVTLGVATMIVVNAVMLGFTNEMQVRIHGILSDVTVESMDANRGFPDAAWHIDRIREVAGDLIEEMTPMIAIPAMLTFRIGIEGEPISVPIELMGIDAVTQSRVSEITQYLQHPNNRRELSFKLHENGYDTQGVGNNGRGAYRHSMRYAGWEYRRNNFAEREKIRIKYEEERIRLEKQQNAARNSITGNSSKEPELPYDPFAEIPSTPVKKFDPAIEQHAGVIIGIGISLYNRVDQVDSETGQKRVIDSLALIPGDDVMITFPTAGVPLKLQSDSFTVVDLYESKMMEYDKSLVFVPIEKLQQLRGMFDPATGKPTVTQILIKAKPDVDIDVIRDKIRAVFPQELFKVSTWRDKQETLLAAVFNELAMLNVLLFLIFAVAGFGILAIFYMIVIEKQKDIGILKSLGASSGGIMQIFLCYSLLLGVVGSGLGLIMGLLFVKYIKEIAGVLSYILRSDVFSPEIYSFYEIPTIVQPTTVFWIIYGAIFIAVASGVLPAIRAARLHPVESLRT